MDEKWDDNIQLSRTGALSAKGATYFSWELHHKVVVLHTALSLLLDCKKQQHANTTSSSPLSLFLSVSLVSHSGAQYDVREIDFWSKHNAQPGKHVRCIPLAAAARGILLIAGATLQRPESTTADKKRDGRDTGNCFGTVSQEQRKSLLRQQIDTSTCGKT